ncbi:MAG: hypothetical protein HY670_08790, partial [Chloroflexi bacterium]|nr:hypothetical protein [Chloroflexota bacterium]
MEITSSALNIGRRSDGTRYFHGLIDEVEIFDRALSQSEIQDIVNADSAGKCSAVGTIVIVKDAVPDDPQDFQFTGDLGNFSLDDDADPTLPRSVSFERLAGTYNVNETVPSGWELTSAICDDGSPVTAIALSEGETVTCTFTNHKHGTIIIRKDAVPDDPQEFAFTSDIPGCASFSLDDDTNPTLLNARTCADVPANSYSVSETIPEGWGLTSTTCDDGSPVTA